jgi:hypothetical protein
VTYQELPFAVLFYNDGVIAAFSDGEFQLRPPMGGEFTQHSDFPVEQVEAFLEQGAILFPMCTYDGELGEA